MSGRDAERGDGDERSDGDERDRTDERDRGAGRGDDAAGPPLSRAGAASLLWGVVGGLSFLVLVQGYELLADTGVALAVKFGVALAVAAVAGGVVHVARGRVSAPG